MKSITFLYEPGVGEVDSVYKTKTGMELAFSDADLEGWRQITLEKRMKVCSKRVSHSAFIWEPVEVVSPQLDYYVW